MRPGIKRPIFGRYSSDCARLTQGFDREICQARERAGTDLSGIGIPLGLLFLALAVALPIGLVELAAWLIL